MTGRFPPPFLLIPLLSDKLLKWSPFPAMSSLPDLIIFVVPDLTLVLLESSPVLVPLEEEFGNLLLKPRAIDLLPVVSKLGEILLSSLLGYILEFFVSKIIFLELDEHEIWVNSSMFIISRSEIWLFLWEGSFLLEQNVFIVAAGPEFLPPPQLAFLDKMRGPLERVSFCW